MKSYHSRSKFWSTDLKFNQQIKSFINRSKVRLQINKLTDQKLDQEITSLISKLIDQNLDYKIKGYINRSNLDTLYEISMQSRKCLNTLLLIRVWLGWKISWRIRQTSAKVETHLRKLFRNGFQINILKGNFWWLSGDSNKYRVLFFGGGEVPCLVCNFFGGMVLQNCVKLVYFLIMLLLICVCVVCVMRITIPIYPTNLHLSWPCLVVCWQLPW